MATGPAVIEENPNRGKLTPEDELILKQPYTQAVSCMGHSSDLVVHAVKMLQKKQKTIEVVKLLLEVEELERIKEECGTLPPLSAKKSPERQRLGSDGEHELDNSEWVEAQPAAREEDLQTDGEQPETQRRKPLILLPEAAAKDDVVQKKDVLKKDVQMMERDKAVLQRKLRALRYENQLLKARQLCRGCRQRPVSITFLPCGHYSYCYDCGQKFGACPICQKTILADVRTFLA